MAVNPMLALRGLGQSVWLDYLSRGLIDSGRLKRLIEEDGLSGVTSNPTIFQKAISGSPDYDEAIRDALASGQRDPKEIFLALAVKDVSDAADVLRPVYESTGGADGYVSIEVSPDLAYDAEATVEEARRLFGEIGKKNVYVKVPATKEGIPAIERLVGEGVNINVTLLFSAKRYEEVMEAYLWGLEKRLRAGEPVEEVSSVASFFVSRVDTLVDGLLEEKIAAAQTGEERKRLGGLLGRAAVSNAKLAYMKYRGVFSGGRFLALKQKGARLQRILWGSTGTKNPSYSDLKYVEEIVGPDSVNTLPEATIEALKDHGRPAVTIGDNLDQARALFGELAAAGIDMGYVTDRLEQEGVKAFSDSFFSLLKEIGEKRDRLAAV